MNDLENKTATPKPADPGITEAGNLLSLMEKTLKSIMVYPEKNPIIKEQKERLCKEFRSYMDEHGPLTITINESTIMIDDSVIYEAKGKGRNLAFLLYRDGVRDITFDEGVTSEEIEDFVEALAENWQTSEDTDVVSSFWEKDFRHINVSAINELFTDFDSSLDALGSSSRHYHDIIYYDTHELLNQEEDGTRTSGLPQWVEEPPDTPPDTSAFMLLDEEKLEEIQKLLKEDKKGYNPSREFAHALFELIFLEDDPEEYRSFLIILKGYFLDLISGADFKMAGWILRFCEKLKENSSLPSSKVETINETLQNTASSPSSIEKIRKTVREGSIDAWEDLLEYSTLLGKTAVPILIELLMQKKAKIIHSDVQALLLKFGKDNIEVLGALLSDKRSHLVGQIIPLLGRADEKAIPYLKRGLHHPDKDVRRKSIRALAQIGGPKVNSLLSKLLTDPDPNIRILSAKCIDSPDEKIVQSVCGLLQKKDFSKRDLVEKKSFVDILRKTESDDAVDALRGILFQKSWFEKEESKRFKHYIAHILADMGTDYAIQTLEEGARMKNRVIHAACKEALSTIEG